MADNPLFCFLKSVAPGRTKIFTFPQSKNVRHFPRSARNTSKGLVVELSEKLHVAVYSNTKLQLHAGSRQTRRLALFSPSVLSIASAIPCPHAVHGTRIRLS